MTREEALRKTEGYLTLALGVYLPLVNCKEVDEIIKALKQEPVLDKISEEVDALKNYSYPFSDMLLDDVQKIIDKYREGKEIEEQEKWLISAKCERVNCEKTKCENCVNHNYCDYEP